MNKNSPLSIKERAKIIDYNLYKKIMSENLFTEYIKFLDENDNLQN